MHNKIRQVHHLNASRDMVHDMMTYLDPEGLQNRLLCFKKKKAKGSFVTKGANWVHSIDGHGKLMGYQRDTFPLVIYGCIDTVSRELLWIKVWTDNSNPLVVARWYLGYLYENRVIAANLRMDKGTETCDIAAMHAFLRSEIGDDDPSESIIYGPSTANQ